MTCNIEELAAPFGPFAREKSRQIATQNTLLFELTVGNSSGSDFVVQLWDVADAADIGSVETEPEYEEVVSASGFLPFAFKSGYQFHRGLYVRAVTAYGGATPIGTDSAKFSGRMISPHPIRS